MALQRVNVSEFDFMPHDTIFCTKCDRASFSLFVKGTTHQIYTLTFTQRQAFGRVRKHTHTHIYTPHIQQSLQATAPRLIEREKKSK